MANTHRLPRVLLHAGTHKTGTTSIQAVCNEHRRELRKQGLVYPDPRSYMRGGAHAHHAVAHALVGTEERAEKAARRFLGGLKRAAPAGGTVLLSSEAFYRHLRGTRQWRSLPRDEYWSLRLRYLSYVADMLSPTEADVLLFLRRPDTFAESLYREMVTKSLTKAPFYKWLRRSNPLFDYDAQIEAFSSAFASVEVVRYENAAAEGLVNAFFRHIGFPAPAPDPWTRRSPDARLILWMHQRRPGTWKQRREFAASQQARNLFDDYGATTLWQSAHDRQAFLERFDGVYGAAFFPPPGDDLHPATLTDADAERIDVAWTRWIEGADDQ
jgi:hypothetical protein